jgi:beta-mannanase
MISCPSNSVPTVLTGLSGAHRRSLPLIGNGWAAVLLAVMSLTMATLSWSASSSLNAGPLHLGIYDPERLFSKSTDFSFEHIFVHWQDFSASNYRSFAQYAAARNRQLMVTVEPWTRAENWTGGGEKLFQDVISGNFDSEIKAICNAIGATRDPVLVRWGHEMEDDSGRYPWANRQPEEYIAAYQYFVDHCRKFAPEAQYVWSPQAKRAVAPYYPGDAHVDFVGISLYVLQAWDIDHFGKALDPHRVVRWSYEKVAGFNKPIVIAELGVSGDDLYKRKWLRSISELQKKFDKLFAVIYFNARETGAWPDPYGSPDWRITPADLNQSR